METRPAKAMEIIYYVMWVVCCVSCVCVCVCDVCAMCVVCVVPVSVFVNGCERACEFRAFENMHDSCKKQFALSVVNFVDLTNFNPEAQQDFVFATNMVHHQLCCVAP